MKIAVVVQRYGPHVNGGAELHARYVAEHLAKHVQVEVLTTCAADYITWRNELTPGPEQVNAIVVRRFPVVQERDPAVFGRLSERVFRERHSVRDELTWLDAEGPTSPELVAYIAQQAHHFDFFIFFSFRYYHTFHGARAVANKAILVPTAERDGALGLGIFGPVLRGVRAHMYNSPEERALIQAAAGNPDVPGVVVGVGSEIPVHVNGPRARQKFNLRDRFAIYVGRIDENKGCAELFDFFQRYSRTLVDGMHLVLIGTPVIPIPDHPKVRHLGFVSDQDKFDAMAAAELLIMPSYLESLSMVALEAWALGKPVLANGRCDVLKGQCIRSNGGLYYENFNEFVETLRTIDFNPSLAAALGRNGREYFNRHYSWPIVEHKYLDMLQRVAQEPAGPVMEPLPGWLARRRQNQPPAEEVVRKLPQGPVLPTPGRRETRSEPGPSEQRPRVDRPGTGGRRPSLGPRQHRRPTPLAGLVAAKGHAASAPPATRARDRGERRPASRSQDRGRGGHAGNRSRRRSGNR